MASFNDLSSSSIRQPARVDIVHIDGIGRTKDDYVKKTIQGIFKVKTFEELLIKAVVIRKNLTKLGCFKTVGVLIDTNKNAGATPQGYEVTFEVQEYKMFVGGINTMVGANEGSLAFSLKFPNVLGRGEKITIDHSIGSVSVQNKSSSISFSKIFPSTWNTEAMFTCLNQTFPNNLSGYTMKSTGSLLDFCFESAQNIKHNIQWEAAWRELEPNFRPTSFAVREQTGHSFKSALRHILTIDDRDNQIFPREGLLLKLLHECAGLGGDVSFIKHDSEVQANFLLPFGLVVQGGFRLGILRPLASRIRGHNIHDLFFLGGPSGPSNLRGFEMKSIGSKSRNDFLGGQAYWSSALHLYTPLPFNVGRGGWGDSFRTHAFFNIGNITDHTSQRKSATENFYAVFQNFRAAYGLGLVFRLGSTAKIELNYCFPLKYLKGDGVVHGIQVGVGAEFL